MEKTFIFEGTTEDMGKRGLNAALSFWVIVKSV